MLLRLQKYSPSPRLTYLKGSEMYITDMLSQAYCQTTIEAISYVNVYKIVSPGCQDRLYEEESSVINQMEYIHMSEATSQQVHHYSVIVTSSDNKSRKWMV